MTKKTAVIERPRYYARQLMTPDVLILEHDYNRDKLRRHNRMLHGWGVVCGADVAPVTQAVVTEKTNGGTGKAKVETTVTAAPVPWKVSVSPGYILSPCGEEIMICSDQVVDVRSFCSTPAVNDLCAPSPDPWCAEVFVEQPESPVYLAVRYKQEAIRPVRAQSMGCGCSENACEYSRWRDSYELCMLAEADLPDAYSLTSPVNTYPPVPLEECPPCPEQLWVVLARIEFDRNGKIGTIDNNVKRRVISFAEAWMVQRI